MFKLFINFRINLEIIRYSILKHLFFLVFYDSSLKLIIFNLIHHDNYEALIQFDGDKIGKTFNAFSKEKYVQFTVAITYDLTHNYSGLPVWFLIVLAIVGGIALVVYFSKTKYTQVFSIID